MSNHKTKQNSNGDSNEEVHDINPVVTNWNGEVAKKSESVVDFDRSEVDGYANTKLKDANIDQILKFTIKVHGEDALNPVVTSQVKKLLMMLHGESFGNKHSDKGQFPGNVHSTHHGNRGRGRGRGRGGYNQSFTSGRGNSQERLDRYNSPGQGYRGKQRGYRGNRSRGRGRGRGRGNDGNHGDGIFHDEGVVQLSEPQ